MKTIAFFGHSQILNCDDIKQRLIKVLTDTKKEYSRFLIGCHGDFDELALSTCLNYKKCDCNINVIVVLTSLSFLNKDKNGYSRADIYKKQGCETVFYDIERVYFKNRITFSNKKMIDESDLIICYVDMRAYQSGAKTAIKYALKQKKKVINLYKKEDNIFKKSIF